MIDGQVPSDANPENVADLLLAVIAYAGLTRADTEQLPSLLRTLRMGIAASGTT